MTIIEESVTLLLSQSLANPSLLSRTELNIRGEVFFEKLSILLSRLSTSVEQSITIAETIRTSSIQTALPMYGLSIIKPDSNQSEFVTTRYPDDKARPRPFLGRIDVHSTFVFSFRTVRTISSNVLH